MVGHKVTFFLVLFAAVVIVAIVSLRPLSLATADKIRAASAGEEAAALARAEEAAALAQLRVQEKQQTSRARVAVTWLGFGAVGLAVAAAAGAVTARAASDIAQSAKEARLPVTRQIAPGAFVTQLDNQPWLIDAYSGRRALLSDGANVDETRALIMGRLLTVDRLAKAAESIAASTNSPAPGDWLSHIGESANNQTILPTVREE
ncbi:MAG: hypothetical protein KC415_22970 [Anaerolineales bacterium]|nr:hypothetical protein [Anaerolineales bacterium]MCB8991831.1 hypothetical protein [Ardenticatenaceae bacterium]